MRRKATNMGRETIAIRLIRQDNFVLEYEYDPQINEEYKHVK
jgi:hypothetical protein